MFLQLSDGNDDLQKVFLPTVIIIFFLQHHMLGPVQRVPRYRLLLDDYVKKLSEDSPDKKQAETALNLITKAATHSNETMKKIVSIDLD